jgi:hypothetical protein
MMTTKSVLSVGVCALVGFCASGCNGADTVVPVPVEGAATRLDRPPIAGGTLAVTRDGSRAIVADPDMDQVDVFDLSGAQPVLTRTIDLELHDEPGRVVEGAPGWTHVVLRRAGVVLSVDLESGDATRRGVCSAPRGIDYDATRQELHVACAGGELVTLSDDLEAPPLRQLWLERDLRDVVVTGDVLLVSRFRSAEVLVVNAEGGIDKRLVPHPFTSNAMGRSFAPAVAWRLVRLADGGAAMVHQRALAQEIPTGPAAPGQNYYGGSCDQGIVHAAVTTFGADRDAPLTETSGGGIGTLVLPVDMAVSPDGAVAIVAAGSDELYVTTIDATLTTDAINDCFASLNLPVALPGQPLAVSYDGRGRLLVQTRGPAALNVVDASGAMLASTALPGESRRSPGHGVFHVASFAGSGIACASCHPEGTEDGRAWQFAGIGLRRTQDLSGGVMQRAPFHWDGALPGLRELMDEVFVTRMGGSKLPDDRVGALGEWLETLPARVSNPVDPEAAERGKALFARSDVGCTTCHAGESLTNNTSVDVGTGGIFQVPSLLGVAQRAPFMHDGCAATLLERFDAACGGDRHGQTSQLSEVEHADLAAYLESL